MPVHNRCIAVTYLIPVLGGLEFEVHAQHKNLQRGTAVAAGAIADTLPTRLPANTGLWNMADSGASRG